MKIGLVIYDRLDTPTGGYLYDRKLVQYLREQGDEVVVISIPRKSSLVNLLDNLDTHLMDRLTALDLDVLVQDELDFPSFCYLNHRLREATYYPIISLVHHLSCRAERRPEKVARLEPLEKRYLASVDGFIFNSCATRDFVRGLCPGADGPVAYPGRDHIRIHTNGASRADSPLKVLYLGNILPHKGLDVLVRAASTLPPGSVAIDVVGAPLDEAYLADVKSMISFGGLDSAVAFHGHVDESRKEELLASSHVLAVPSYQEGYGLVFVEALAHGLPVIAPSCGGAGEIVTEGREGFLVSPGDDRAVAGALASLCDKGTWEKMAGNARRRFSELPTWEESMSRVREYLLEVSLMKRSPQGILVSVSPIN